MSKSLRKDIYIEFLGQLCSVNCALFSFLRTVDFSIQL